MKDQEPLRFLKLPFQFNSEKLKHDLSLLVNTNWIPHFNESGYNGEWNAIPLYAPGGDESNIFAFSPTDAKMQETPIMTNCSYFKEIIGMFKCPIESARLLRLRVGAEIKPHRDHELGYEDGTFRIHIPIVTNEEVRFILDGNQLTMLPGECWYTNVNYVHSVSNTGENDRVHLVIDGSRNEWSDELFFSLAPENSFRVMPIQNESREVIERTIEELLRSDQPATKHLIEELRTKLAELD